MTNRAKAVAALANECAEAGDRDGQLAAPVVEAFHREGLLGMWVPRSLRGGAELAPLPSMDVLEQVTYGDASAGWVLMATCLATGTGGAYLGDEAVAELFGKERLPVIAGQGRGPGRPRRWRADSGSPDPGASRLGSSTARTSTRSASCPTPARPASSCSPSARPR